MVSGHGLRQKQQVVHIFTSFAEVDKNPLIGRDTPQQRLQNSDQYLTKKQRKHWKSRLTAVLKNTLTGRNTMCMFLCRSVPRVQRIHTHKLNSIDAKSLSAAKVLSGLLKFFNSTLISIDDNNPELLHILLRKYTFLHVFYSFTFIFPCATGIGATVAAKHATSSRCPSPTTLRLP